jgi:hypothetical protein
MDYHLQAGYAQPDLVAVDRSQDRPQLKRRITRKQLLAGVPLVLIIVLSVTVLHVLAKVRADALPMRIELPEKYLPGSPLPASVYCEYYDYRGEKFCFGSWQGQSLNLVYDVQRRMIIKTALSFNKPVKIGDLIVSWGHPTGYTRGLSSFRIFWDQRSIYVNQRDFGPDSQSSFIYLQLDPPKNQPWQGFINQHS